MKTICLCLVLFAATISQIECRPTENGADNAQDQQPHDSNPVHVGNGKTKPNANQRSLFGKGSAYLGGAALLLGMKDSFPANVLSHALNAGGQMLGTADALAGNIPLIGGYLG